MDLGEGNNYLVLSCNLSLFLYTIYMNIHAGLIQALLASQSFLFSPQIATLLDLCILLDNIAI